MNFKKFLDERNIEYHYYGEHNVLSINYDNVENRVEVKETIDELCKTYGFINGVRITGRAVLEVSKNPQVIKEFGFESEPYSF